MYFILYLIREAVNLPMPFLILLNSLPLTEKNGKSNLFIKYYFPYIYYYLKSATIIQYTIKGRFMSR